MALTRRSFLRTGVMSAFSAGFIIGSARIGFAQTSTAGPAIPIEAQQDPVFSFVPDTFRPYVGGYFEAPNARGQMVALKLLSLQIYKPPKSALKLTTSMLATQSFRLLFQAEAALPPFTSIHKIKHPSLGQFYLFLTPKKGEGGELLYEAIITHLQ